MLEHISLTVLDNLISVGRVATNGISNNNNSDVQSISTAPVNKSSINIESTSIANGNVPLVDLTEDEVQSLVVSSKLGTAVGKVFAENGITGAILRMASREDLLELGLRNIHVNTVLQSVEDWNTNGVPSHLIRR